MNSNLYENTKLIIVSYKLNQNSSDYYVNIIQAFYSYELKSLEIICNPIPIIENHVATNIQTKCYKIYFGIERSFFERRHDSVKFDGAFR